MRRADRLFQLIEILRRRRHVVTARRLAEELEVSERTIYRDVRDLVASGVPLEGEPGVGYRLRGYDLPPLMFSPEEVEALVLGVRIVESWTDPGLARAARQVLAKVEAVLPKGRDHLVRDTLLFAPEDHARAPLRVDLGELRQAVRGSRKVRFRYTDAHGTGSLRTVRPLGLAFYGPIWLLVAWCELRRDFRAFRPDRMDRLEVLEEGFLQEPGQTLRDYLAMMEELAGDERRRA